MNLKNIFFPSEAVHLTKDENRDNEPIGDGGAVFISDATDEEYEEYVHNEEKGWGKFKKILEIIKS